MLGLLLPGGLGAQGSTPTAKDPGVTSVSPPPGSLSGAERLRYHVLSTVGVGAFAGPVLGAGLAQWRDVPPEWGEGMSGFGRYGFRLGQNATEQVIQFGAGAALRQDPRYFRSQNAGFWRRVGHAISYTFTAPTASGSRQPAVFRFAGAYGGAAISKTWYPGERETWKHTLALGSTSLAFDAASNLGLEFWPDIKKKLFRRR